MGVPFSPDQFWGGDPVWTGYSRGPGCGLDSREHLLGGEQSGPDRGGQTGWDYENHPAGWGGGAPKGHCPRPSWWVRSIDFEILNLQSTFLENGQYNWFIFCWQYFILDRLGCQSAQDWGSIYEWWRQTHHPQGNRQWWLAQRTHCGLHGKTHCLDWCQVAFSTSL